jgi:predicted transcriptional regulator of viral defense system
LLNLIAAISTISTATLFVLNPVVSKSKITKSSSILFQSIFKSAAVRVLIELSELLKKLFNRFNIDKDFFMPDWHLITEYLVNDAQHYIGYYSALQIHNLITQPSLKEQVVVSKQIHPSEVKIKDVSFQFIYHNEQHFFGAKKIWINSFDKVLCSDLEKTIIDCLFKPEYAGGIVEVAKAIYTSKDKIKFDTLLEYAKKFDSQAVIKRMGFILEMLNIHSKIINDLQAIKTASYVVLDTALPKVGKHNSRWSIQQNLDTETIKSAIYT